MMQMNIDRKSQQLLIDFSKAFPKIYEDLVDAFPGKDRVAGYLADNFSESHCDKNLPYKILLGLNDQKFRVCKFAHYLDSGISFFDERFPFYNANVLHRSDDGQQLFVAMEGPEDPEAVVRMFTNLVNEGIEKIVAIGPSREQNNPKFHKYIENGIHSYTSKVDDLTLFTDFLSSENTENSTDHIKEHAVKITRITNLKTKNTEVCDLKIKVLHLPTVADYSTLKDFKAHELFRIFQFLDSPGSIALHCSAGVGRVSILSISFIAAKCGIFSVENGVIRPNAVEEFKKLFKSLRRERPGLCYNKEQYRQILYLSAVFTLFAAGVEPQIAITALNEAMKQAAEEKEQKKVRIITQLINNTNLQNSASGIPSYVTDVISKLRSNSQDDKIARDKFALITLHLLNHYLVEHKSPTFTVENNKENFGFFQNNPLKNIIKIILREETESSLSLSSIMRAMDEINDLFKPLPVEQKLIKMAFDLNIQAINLKKSGNVKDVKEVERISQIAQKVINFVGSNKDPNRYYTHIGLGVLLSGMIDEIIETPSKEVGKILLHSLITLITQLVDIHAKNDEGEKGLFYLQFIFGEQILESKENLAEKGIFEYHERSEEFYWMIGDYFDLKSVENLGILGLVDEIRGYKDNLRNIIHYIKSMTNEELPTNQISSTF